MTKRRTRRAMLLALCAAVFFGWGYMAHRNGFFPQGLLHSLAGSLGLGGEEGATGASRRGLGTEAAPADGLFGLAYMDGTVDAETSRSGVLLDRRGETWPGLNLYCPRIRPVARLVDMDGEVRHEWTWGEFGWQHAQVFPDGRLLALVEDHSLLMLDRDSNLLWKYEAPVHHDFWVDDSGLVYVLQRHVEDLPEVNAEIPTRADEIAVLDSEGHLQRILPVTEWLLASPYRPFLPMTRHLTAEAGAGPSPGLDLLHMNHVEVFDGSLDSRSPLFRRGNILVSMRTISAIAILDGDSGEVLWFWGPGNLVYPHHPSLLPDGELLIFNNGTRASEVLQVDPLSFDLTWRYAPGARFFSRFRGSAQRLPNGNTLITESDRGYVHEVKPDGTAVWRYACSDWTDEGARVAIWRMTRYAPQALPFLQD